MLFFLSGNSYPNNTIDDVLHDFKSTNLVIQELLNAMTFTSFKGLFFLHRLLRFMDQFNLLKI